MTLIQSGGCIGRHSFAYLRSTSDSRRIVMPRSNAWRLSRKALMLFILTAGLACLTSSDGWKVRASVCMQDCQTYESDCYTSCNTDCAGSQVDCSACMSSCAAQANNCYRHSEWCEPPYPDGILCSTPGYCCG